MKSRRETLNRKLQRQIKQARQLAALRDDGPRDLGAQIGRTELDRVESLFTTARTVRRAHEFAARSIDEEFSAMDIASRAAAGARWNGRLAG